MSVYQTLMYVAPDMLDKYPISEKYQLFLHGSKSSGLFDFNFLCDSHISEGTTVLLMSEGAPPGNRAAMEHQTVQVTHVKIFLFYQ